jgi:hypothetical protein
MVIVVALKRGVLAFWGLWLTIVTATNVTDLLQTIGVLGTDWRWVSGNYALVAKALELYALPAGIVRLIFGTVIVWEGATAALLWYAAAAYRGREGPGLRAAYLALGVALALWGAFQVMEELTFQYAFEAVHRDLFTGTLATLLVIALVPER